MVAPAAPSCSARGSDAAGFDSRTGGAAPRATASRRIVFLRASSCLLLALVTMSGCATHAKRLELARRDFYRGDLHSANERLVEEIARQPKDVEVLQLDQAMIELLQGRPDQAERLLLESRDRLAFHEQRDVGETAMTWLTDDTKRAYEGDDYEKVLLRVFLALSNLMDDGDDVTAYAFQINETQQRIINEAADPEGENPKAAYTQVALGPYLYGLIREATHLNYDDAERAYERVVEWAPNFPAGVEDLERARGGVHCEQGNGVVYVIGLVGRGPYKVERDEIPTSQAMLIADRILSAVGEHNVTPTIAPIKIPAIYVPANPLDRLAVFAGDQYVGDTEVITDVGQLARDQYQAMMPQVMGKAIARRAVKKAALYAAKSAMNTQGIGELALDLVGIAWEATEAADTRCWGLLPETIQVRRIELPAGRHRLSVQPRQGESVVGNLDTFEVEVVESRNTFVMLHYPSTQRLGEVLRSTH
ncbi:MAG: hypothetical protein KDA83_15220 [Planctomycetales bacterium]|nr:hypothetical protein [Planctomycetales bacterium]